jgi:tetratricopeptide (TPR) repeat protein
MGDAAVTKDSDQARFRFFDSFAGFLTRLAASKPLLVVLDDLHCADRGSLLLLQFLSDITEAAMLLVAAYRDVSLSPQVAISPVLEVISRKIGAEKISLGGLCESDIGTLMCALGGVEPSEALMRALFERTEGNPFFLREVFGILAASGNFRQSNAQELHRTVPLTVRVVINQQLSSLRTEVAAVLRVASVIGREFEGELVLNSANGSLEELGRFLDEAVSAKILQPLDVMRYQFKHALVRETIYESLPTIERAKIHLGVAEALERRGGFEREATLSMLAYHTARALPCGTVEKALDYAMRAGHEARRRLAYEEAVGHYQRAVELVGSRVSAESYCDILLALGESQGRAGLWLDSRRTFGHAASEARSLKSPTHLARAAIGFKGEYGGTLPVDEGAIALLREAVARLDGKHAASQVRVLSALTSALYFARSPEEMEECSVQAIEIAERLNDQELRGVALQSRLISLVRPTHLTQMLEVASKVLSTSIATGDVEMEFRARLIRHLGYLELGRTDASWCELDRAAIIAKELKDPRCAWQTTLIRSSEALTAGDLAESARLSELARSIGERVHDSLPTHYFLQQRFHQDRMRGRLQGWEEVVAAAVAQYPEVIGYRIAQAAIWGAIGEIDRARSALALLAIKHFRDIPCDALFLWTLSLLAEVCAVCGTRECSEDLYELLVPYRDHNVVVVWGLVFDGSVAHFLGVLSAALGRLEEAASHFEFAIARNTEMGAPLLVGRTKVHYSELLLARRSVGDEELALELLTQAIETMHRTGQAGYLVRAEQLVAGIRSATCGSPSERLPLSPVDGRRATNGACVFRRESGFWTIVFDGEVLRIKDSRGLAYLACLLRTPRQDIHVLDLVVGVSGGMVVGDGAASVEDRGGLRYDHALGDAGPMADEKAREDYRRRLAEIDAELAEAEEFNDLGRTPRLRLEREEIAAELKRAYGLNGRLRVTSSAAERARISVRNRITATIERIGRAHPSLRRHLEAAVRTGTYCSYRPERPVPWSF